MKKLTLIALAALSSVTLASLSGCASKQPPAELIDARNAYARAQSGPAAQANPAGLYEAKRSLDQAERLQSDSPGSDEARSLAYIADRKVLLAESNARMVMAQSQAAQAKASLDQIRTMQLSSATSQVESERNARADAERRAKDAVDRLNKLAQVKDDARGIVVTLSGSVLFPTNQSDLTPASRSRLSQVADALKDVKGRKITVEGYTDSTGSDQRNEELSKQRANTVRDFLIQNGVPDDMISAEGKGKSDPVASNANAEGRANNRRVEIVIQKDHGTDMGKSGTQGAKP